MNVLLLLMQLAAMVILSHGADVERRKRPTALRDCTKVQTCAYLHFTCQKGIVEKNHLNYYTTAFYNSQNRADKLKDLNTITDPSKSDVLSCREFTKSCAEVDRMAITVEQFEYEEFLDSCVSYVAYLAKEMSDINETPLVKEITSQDVYEKVMNKLMDSYSLERLVMKQCFREFCMKDDNRLGK